MTESSTVDIDLLYSGQYHEVNPGQYHEVHPGQYHEVNPGQYQEEVFTKPVSSKYPSKGQYRNHEDSYSEEYEVTSDSYLDDPVLIFEVQQLYFCSLGEQREGGL